MAIEFTVWIDNIVRHASFIGDREMLKRVWLQGEKGITSLINYEEAWEQLVDTDAFGYLESYSNHSSLSPAQQHAVREYIEAFRNFNDQPFLQVNFVDPKAVILSPQWSELEEKAKALASLFGHEGYWR